MCTIVDNVLYVCCLKKFKFQFRYSLIGDSYQYENTGQHELPIPYRTIPYHTIAYHSIARFYYTCSCMITRTSPRCDDDDDDGGGGGCGNWYMGLSWVDCYFLYSKRAWDALRG